MCLTSALFLALLKSSLVQMHQASKTQKILIFVEVLPTSTSAVVLNKKQGWERLTQYVVVMADLQVYCCSYSTGFFSDKSNDENPQ